MLHKYWETDTSQPEEEIGARLSGWELESWQKLRDMHPKKNNADLLRYSLQVTAGAIRAHSAGTGPYVDCDGRAQVDAFAAIDFPCQDPKRWAHKQTGKPELVHTILTGPRLHDYRTIQSFMPKANTHAIVVEAMRLTRLADIAETAPNSIGLYIFDPLNHQVTSLYEILGIGRWDPAKRLHIVTTPPQKGAQP